MKRVFAEESAYRIDYVVLHEEHEYRERENEHQRDLAEICQDLFVDLRTSHVEFRPVTEACLTVCVKAISSKGDEDQDKELGSVFVLEERNDLILVCRENKSRKECRC